MQEPILKVKNLVKKYKDEKGSDSVILDNINLEVEKNEFLCILGSSGCGKTTFLRCIAGFEDFEGEMFVHGEIEKKPNRHRIMVFQEFNQLFPWKTVEKNVQYPLKLAGLKDKNELTKISDEYLSKVGLSDRKKHFPHQLSGGMKQRVAIARSLAIKPSLILMDEPFASLDAQTRISLQKELLKIKKEEDMTVIFVTHNIMEALKLGTRIIMMGNNKGDIKLDVKPDLEKPVTPETEGYAHYWGMFNDALGRR